MEIPLWTHPEPCDLEFMPSPADVGVMPSNGLQKLGFRLLVFYVFGVFSAVLDLIPFMYMVRPMVISGFLGFLVVLITGSFGRLVQHKIGLFLLLFTGWFICCIPMSVWPGGAFHVLTNDWQKALFTFFLAGGLIIDHKQYRKVLHVLGYAAILLALAALRANVLDMGRLTMARTRYENPNDLAMILVTAVPCLGYMALSSDKKFPKIIAALGLFPVLLAIAKTGSRGALLGGAVMMLIVFLEATFRNKAKVLVAVVAVAIFGAILLPQDLRTRMFTIFGDEADMGEEASGSAYSRKMLLLDSITLTFRNPIFGVGPGMFPVAQDKLARSRGESMGNWHVTHNTYTQVSSETGLPGFILFMGALLQAFWCLRRVERIRNPGPHWHNLRLMAQTVRVSLWSFCTISFFSSVAYLPFFPILCGLCVALDYVARSMMTAEARSVAQRPVGFVPALPVRAGLSPA